MNRFETLTRLIEQNATSDGIHETRIPRLFLARSSAPTEPLHGLQAPALCIVTQGRKQVMLGDRVYLYDCSCCLVASSDVPIVGQVIEATPEVPYLSLRLDLDVKAIGELMIEMSLASGPAEQPGPSLSLSVISDPLLDAVTRLVGALSCPKDTAILAPLAEREILYRLLTGEHAGKLRQIARADSRLAQVNRAIAHLRETFDRPFRMEEVARAAGMSPSVLHEHFRAVTALSPLQYQKQLRLQEARRLMLTMAMDAAAAGHRVGYDSPSQFSREYARLFGAPPARDVSRLRGEPAMVLGA